MQILTSKATKGNISQHEFRRNPKGKLKLHFGRIASQKTDLICFKKRKKKLVFNLNLVNGPAH